MPPPSSMGVTQQQPYCPAKMPRNLKIYIGRLTEFGRANGPPEHDIVAVIRDNISG